MRVTKVALELMQSRLYMRIKYIALLRTVRTSCAGLAVAKRVPELLYRKAYDTEGVQGELVTEQLPPISMVAPDRRYAEGLFPSAVNSAAPRPTMRGRVPCRAVQLAWA
jgi:hypothetical protein